MALPPIPTPLRLWSIDIAREQTFTREHMRNICRMSLEHGANGIGLYLEHRFRWPIGLDMVPADCLGPEDIAALEEEFPDLMLIPMINLLGHMEGFLRCEGGEELSEEPFKGLQACACHRGTKELASKIIDGALAAFAGPIVHLGGDEPATLGVCPLCAAAIAEYEAGGSSDGKADLYAAYYLPFIERVLAAGRIPALWADFLNEHPAALDLLPKECLLFDWQYHHGPAETAETLAAKGFQVVVCPALHTYNAAWLHIPESEANIRDHTAAANELDLAGVCLTTWEFGLFGSFETHMPIVAAGLGMIAGRASGLLDPAAGASEDFVRWARLMGEDLPHCGPAFAYSGIRSGLKCRFMLYRNPFLLWLRQRSDLTGSAAAEALAVLEKAEAAAPDAACRGVSEFVRMAIEFVALVEKCAAAYRVRDVGGAVGALAACRRLFEHLERVATASQIRFGASDADAARARGARQQVERVTMKVKEFGDARDRDGNPCARPSFEHLCHPMFTAGDQGAWWLVNRFARE